MIKKSFMLRGDESYYNQLLKTNICYLEVMKMQFIIYNFDEPQMLVELNLPFARSEWLTDKRHIKIPRSLYPENITAKAVSKFCESRQPPRNRVGINELLRKKYKMWEYLPIQMCKKSRGITHSDDLWLLFDDAEKVPYASITVR